MNPKLSSPVAANFVSVFVSGIYGTLPRREEIISAGRFGVGSGTSGRICRIGRNGGISLDDQLDVRFGTCQQVHHFSVPVVIHFDAINLLLNLFELNR